jgi:hypothetical protein
MGGMADIIYWRTLEAAYSGDLSIAAFEQWLYATPELEFAIGAESYYALLCFDFKQAHAVHELKKLIASIYEARRPGEMDYDEAYRLATQFLAGQRDLWSVARAFTQLSHNGHEEWIPSEFAYVDSELDTFPAPAVRPMWNSQALSRLLQSQEPILKEFDRALREACEEVLAHLATRGPAP